VPNRENFPLATKKILQLQMDSAFEKENYNNILQELKVGPGYPQ
jgi:hypothetical protein